MRCHSKISFSGIFFSCKIVKYVFSIYTFEYIFYVDFMPIIFIPFETREHTHNFAMPFLGDIILILIVAIVGDGRFKPIRVLAIFKMRIVNHANING